MLKFRVRFDVEANKCSDVFKLANLMKNNLLMNGHLLVGEKVKIGSFKIEVNV